MTLAEIVWQFCSFIAPKILCRLERPLRAQKRMPHLDLHLLINPFDPFRFIVIHSVERSLTATGNCQYQFVFDFPLDLSECAIKALHTPYLAGVAFLLITLLRGAATLDASRCMNIGTRCILSNIRSRVERYPFRSEMAQGVAVSFNSNLHPIMLNCQTFDRTSSRPATEA